MILQDYSRSLSEKVNSQVERFVEEIVISKWNNARLVKYEAVASGRINNIYRLVLNQAPVRSTILRVRYMDDIRYRQGFASESFLNLILRDRGFGFLPEIYACDDSRKHFPFDYSLLEDIPGEHLCNNHSEDIFYKAGIILGDIHSVPVSFLGKFADERKNKGDSAVNFYSNYFKTITNQFIGRHPGLGKKVVRVLDEYFNPFAYEDLKPVLLHHDYHGRNILIRDAEEPCIIDWESSRGGIKEIDFIKYKHLTMRNCDSQKKIAFINGYHTTQPFSLTVNYILQEIIWMAKMYLFESDWPTADRDYFPDCEYYLYNINDYCEKVKAWKDEYKYFMSNKNNSSAAILKLLEVN